MRLECYRDSALSCLTLQSLVFNMFTTFCTTDKLVHFVYKNRRPFCLQKVPFIFVFKKSLQFACGYVAKYGYFPLPRTIRLSL
jgi:hypothetical protein